MTPAGPARPRSAMELLFSLGEDAPGALADRILSAGAGGNLGSALENLPKVTREAAVREVTAEAAGLLDVNLMNRVPQALSASRRRPGRELRPAKAQRRPSGRSTRQAPWA